MDTLLTVALIAVCTAALTAMHLHLTTWPPEPVIIRTTNDIDAEFFRIIGRDWSADSRPDRHRTA